MYQFSIKCVSIRTLIKFLRTFCAGRDLAILAFGALLETLPAAGGARVLDCTAGTGVRGARYFAAGASEVWANDLDAGGSAAENLAAAAHGRKLTVTHEDANMLLMRLALAGELFDVVDGAQSAPCGPLPARLFPRLRPAASRLPRPVRRPQWTGSEPAA